MQMRLRFELVALHFWRKSRTKRWFWRLGASLLEEVLFWRLGASLLEEVSYETLVLETLALHFWRKSRTKGSFYQFSGLDEVSDPEGWMSLHHFVSDLSFCQRLKKTHVSRMRSRGLSFNSGGLGVEPGSRRVVSASATVPSAVGR